MTIQTTYTHARAHLAELLNAVVTDREMVIIQRRGAEDVALIAAAELESLLETAHLLRSPKNAERLLAALTRAQTQTLPPQSIDELRREVQLAPVEPAP
jgi:antitoxin YefM